MSFTLQAWLALWARYFKVFGAAWQYRHELAGPARMQDEIAFLPAALSLQETPPHPAPRRAAWVLCALFAAAIAWSCIGEVDIVAVAPGRIIVSERSKIIQPLEAGPSINLAPTLQSGLVNGGNEVLATGSFVRNGVTYEAQAARFIANPVGNTVSASGTGVKVTAQDLQTTYVSSVTTGEAIDVATKGVKNAYGNAGNDTLTGDANANWLVGAQGSDVFNAGAGDDMLIIDAEDLQANIHAGVGMDMLQVVGSTGVTINLAQAEVEVAVGSTGDDVFVGGGRSSVFVRANDGNDILIGDAANDALSGENGADLIDGGAGNDVLFDMVQMFVNNYNNEWLSIRKRGKNIPNNSWSDRRIAA
jgi:Ca2+-binding RTX toxin-like protein